MNIRHRQRVERGKLGAMKRVAIVGPGGAGKSTFARALSERIGLPVVHLDHHFWKPGWVESSRDEWRSARADTVILVARPRLAKARASTAR